VRVSVSSELGSPMSSPRAPLRRASTLIAPGFDVIPQPWGHFARAGPLLHRRDGAACSLLQVCQRQRQGNQCPSRTFGVGIFTFFLPS
jgi:hypothetical protein